MTPRAWFEYGLGLLEAHRATSPLHNAREHPTTVGSTVGMEFADNPEQAVQNLTARWGMK